MIELPEGIDSVFRYIVITAQRAEQLIQSAKPRMESKHVKASLIAKDEVDADLVEWRVLTPEEVEARRQAVVDELKAEMAGPEGAVRDVLPTEPEPEEGSRDEELARLQKLFGMALAEEERRAAEQSGADDEEVEEVSLEEAAAEEENGSGDDTDEV